jgi:hypothetical protein
MTGLRTLALTIVMLAGLSLVWIGFQAGTRDEGRPHDPNLLNGCYSGDGLRARIENGRTLKLSDGQQLTIAAFADINNNYFVRFISEAEGSPRPLSLRDHANVEWRFRPNQKLLLVANNDRVYELRHRNC